MEIEIPAWRIVDALAGKTTIFKEYRLPATDPVAQAFKEGWAVELCSLKEGDIRAGEGPKIVLVLSPPLLDGLIAKKEK